MKLAICEDNPSHYEIIHTILQKYPPGAFEITHFASGDEFLRTVAENGCPYSIVLTDIDLGSDNVNGISLAEKINYISPDTQIIFISQYLQYATAVYETEHAYFIHKQQMEKYLPLALRTACQKLEKLHTRYLYFSGNSRNYQVLCSDILYLERNLRSDHDLYQNRNIYNKRRLTALTERMKPDFCLCHNSFAVNLHAVRTYSHKGIILSDNTEIPVSRSYYQQFKDAFAFMMLAGHREVQVNEQSYDQSILVYSIQPLSVVLDCFYFCCRILPSKHKISLPLFLCLSVFMALLFWIKRESQHNGITIVFQLTTFLVTLFLFQASFMKKLAVYFIFQLLIICPEILCTSVFIALHNLFIPTDTYTPHNLISSCSPAEYFVIELSNILLGLFLLWKISEILRQCIDYLKILTFYNCYCH